MDSFPKGLSLSEAIALQVNIEMVLLGRPVTILKFGPRENMRIDSGQAVEECNVYQRSDGTYALQMVDSLSVVNASGNWLVTDDGVTLQTYNGLGDRIYFAWIVEN